MGHRWEREKSNKWELHGMIKRRGQGYKSRERDIKAAWKGEGFPDVVNDLLGLMNEEIKRNGAPCRESAGFDDLMERLTEFRKAAILTIMVDSRKKKKIQIKISKGKRCSRWGQGETRREFPVILSPWSPVDGLFSRR